MAGNPLEAVSLAGSAAFVARSPWISDPPLVSDPVPGGVTLAQLPMNRSWDPGALVDAGEQRSQWDYLVIEGGKTPGIAQVTATRRNELDRKKTSGKSGETLTQLGVRCAEIQVRIRLLTQADLDTWTRDFVPILMPVPQEGKKDPEPVGIYHPALNTIHVRAAIVDELGAPRSVGPGEPLEVSIRLVEFRKPVDTGANTPLGPRRKVNVPDVKKTTPASAKGAAEP